MAPEPLVPPLLDEPLLDEPLLDEPLLVEPLLVEPLEAALPELDPLEPFEAVDPPEPPEGDFVVWVECVAGRAVEALVEAPGVGVADADEAVVVGLGTDGVGTWCLRWWRFT